MQPCIKCITHANIHGHIDNDGNKIAQADIFNNDNKIVTFIITFTITSLPQLVKDNDTQPCRNTFSGKCPALRRLVRVKTIPKCLIACLFSLLPMCENFNKNFKLFKMI